MAVYSPEQAQLLESFRSAYRDFNAASIAALKPLYSDQIHFKDPVHSVFGWTKLERYFLASSRNLQKCEFIFLDEVVSPGAAFFKWQMNYSHRKIAAGANQQLEGATFIKMGQGVVYHEDFYDLGAMVYEKIPLLGCLVHKVKARIGAGNSDH